MARLIYLGACLYVVVHDFQDNLLHQSQHQGEYHQAAGGYEQAKQLVDSSGCSVWEVVAKSEYEDLQQA